MITYHPYDQTTVDALRAGGPDVYGNVPERAISSGQGTPCRSCLKTIPKGAEMLICAARPFPTLHAYAETGPIFLCAAPCTPHAGQDTPAIMESYPDYLVKAYDADDRIVYGSGRVTPVAEVPGYAADLLAMDAVAFVDVRSARNNCFLTRITDTP